MIRVALAAVVASPSFAQSTTTTEYYVVQDTASKKCTIVDKKPTTSTMVQVGPMVFKTRTEAESGIKTIKVCETKLPYPVELLEGLLHRSIFLA
jgi:hypothetical protein